MSLCVLKVTFLYLSHFSSIAANKTVFCTCASALICEYECVSGHVLYTDVLYILDDERCSDKSVLLEVNSQEDGSVCCVFIGTMIHINNLATLP